MIRTIVTRSILAALCAALFALPGCLGSDDDQSGGVFARHEGGLKFWAVDFRTGGYYPVSVVKAGEGDRCRIYVEAGRSVSPAAIGIITSQFDNAIYPGVTSAFGDEPNPGIDGDPKIYILLLDIRDGASPGGSFVAGYFAPINEFLQRDIDALGIPAKSNEKEIFFMDIFPGDPESPSFYGTLAHEFQHMVHFNKEMTTKFGASDDIWLNEAMSEAAPVYCGYGPNYSRVDTFQSEPWNSLTTWDGRIEDYGVAYMWAQYVKDRIVPAGGTPIFRRMLDNPLTGIDSVNAALFEIGYVKDFAGIFRDFSVAAYTGWMGFWPDNLEWSYASINTWPGTYGGISLAGPFPAANDNASTLRPLGPWSVDYYRYTPAAGNSGTVTWTATSPAGRATLADNASIVFDALSGVPFTYTGAGYLIVQNPSSNGAPGDNVSSLSLRKANRTAAQMVSAAGESRAARRHYAMTGRPLPLCVHGHLAREAAEALARGAKPSF